MARVGHLTEPRTGGTEHPEDMGGRDPTRNGRSVSGQRSCYETKISQGALGGRGGHFRWSLSEAACPVAGHDLVTAELLAQSDEGPGLGLGGEGLVISATGCLGPVDAVLLVALLDPHVVLLVCRACLDTTDRPVPKLRGNRRPRELFSPCREADKRTWTGAPRGGRRSTFMRVSDGT